MQRLRTIAGRERVLRGAARAWMLSVAVGSGAVGSGAVGSGAACWASEEPSRSVLPGTSPLTTEEDLASAMIDGIDAFLLEEIRRSVERRDLHWRVDRSSWDAYQSSVEPLRKRLGWIVGARDERTKPPRLELVATPERSALRGEGATYRILAVRWQAFADVHSEGLLLEPVDAAPTADVIAIPDASQTPEMLCGLIEGIVPDSQLARRLAEAGCRVLVPALVDRGTLHRRLSNREFVYRTAFEMGRHVIGYEVQKVLAAVDWFCSDSADGDPIVGVAGWGEGGLLALYAAALDRRIDAAWVSGYFGPREEIWKEPIDRNVFGLLDGFGDAGVARLVAPRGLVVEAAQGPFAEVPPGTGGAPGRLATPTVEAVKAELARALDGLGGLQPAAPFRLVESGGGTGPSGSDEALGALLELLRSSPALGPSGDAPRPSGEPEDPQARQARLVRELERHGQWLLSESPYVREEYFRGLDASSLDSFARTIEPYRQYFEEDVVGKFPYALSPPRPRSRQILDEAAYDGYDVVLDVFPEVFAYGILLVPKGIPAGERRPVVVCQHGLEGRPRDVADPGVENPYYGQFACRLAERGYVTFAPQNPYIFGDRFRSLQRKANPLKKTLFSIIVPQHRQITRWLGSLPFVDPDRIGFYGLSYGGKTAMRVPPLVEEYCLSICSADFNDWIWKNVSTRSQYSYVWTGEYEIFEYDLGSTFNYAEMAALIAPRPFMVERGHFDAVAPDERVAYEFAKVRFLYAAKLGLGDRCTIEWFVGPHAIHAQGTFGFLERHLRPPR